MNINSTSLLCSKVGAPTELASFLEEIARENHNSSNGFGREIGDDPELDEFMVLFFCDHKLKFLCTVM